MVITGIIKPRLSNMDEVFTKTIHFGVLIISLGVYNISRYNFVFHLSSRTIVGYWILNYIWILLLFEISFKHFCSFDTHLHNSKPALLVTLIT